LNNLNVSNVFTGKGNTTDMAHRDILSPCLVTGRVNAFSFFNGRKGKANSKKQFESKNRLEVGGSTLCKRKNIVGIIARPISPFWSPLTSTPYGVS